MGFRSFLLSYWAIPHPLSASPHPRWPHKSTHSITYRETFIITSPLKLKKEMEWDGHHVKKTLLEWKWVGVMEDVTLPWMITHWIIYTVNVAQRSMRRTKQWGEGLSAYLLHCLTACFVFSSTFKGCMMYVNTVLVLHFGKPSILYVCHTHIDLVLKPRLPSLDQPIRMERQTG